jgi:hypothetical protein
MAELACRIIMYVTTGEGDRVSLHLDELATKIASLDPAEQEALWKAPPS